MEFVDTTKTSPRLAPTIHIDDDLPDLPPITHQGRHVITTELLARVYGVEPKALHDNYQDNVNRFVEGTHYHRLTGDQLRAFKNYPENSGVVGKRAPHLILWTERGAARHAKMLNTDEAWSVFEKLETAYFDKGAAEAESKPKVATPASAVAAFKAFSRFGKLIGLDRNQTIIRANKAVLRDCGLDLLAAMGSPLIEAPHQEALMTVTELGMKLGGKNARDTNILLTDRGFQVASRDHKNALHYEATEKGGPYSRMIDSDKAHNSGAPVLQLRWLTSVIEPLSAELAETVPA